LADGAYDKYKIYDALEERDDCGNHIVTIPPRSDAIVSNDFRNNPTQRDQHVKFIDMNGRESWDNKVSYNRRLLVENAMGRFKGIIGASQRARDFFAQQTEAILACKILNKMISLRTPLRQLI